MCFSQELIESCVKARFLGTLGEYTIIFAVFSFFSSVLLKKARKTQRFAGFGAFSQRFLLFFEILLRKLVTRGENAEFLLFFAETLRNFGVLPENPQIYLRFAHRLAPKQRVS